MQTFKDEDAAAGELHTQQNACRKALLESLATDQFAGICEQTHAYCIFAVRCDAQGKEFMC